MKTIGLIVNTAKPQTAAILPRLAGEAARLGIQLVTSQTLASAPASIRKLDADAFARSIDALITLGGDGTLLHAARLVNRTGLPVLGINMGRLGFLTSATEGEVDVCLKALVSGNYATSSRAMLEAEITRAGSSGRQHLRALNDIVVGWGQSTRIVTLDVSINEELVTSYRCDGIIVSTPTGSTGHSLSAGGPIMHPESASLLINVVCPHTLSARPLVVPDSVQIKITVRQTAKNLLVSVDGNDESSVSEGDSLLIRQSPQKINLIHLPGYRYFSVLRQKLQWSGSSA